MGNLGLGLQTSVRSSCSSSPLSLPRPPVRHPALPQSETNLTPLSEFSGHHNSPNFLDFPVGLGITLYSTFVLTPSYRPAACLSVEGPCPVSSRGRAGGHRHHCVVMARPVVGGRERRRGLRRVAADGGEEHLGPAATSSTPRGLARWAAAVLHADAVGGSCSALQRRGGIPGVVGVQMNECGVLAMSALPLSLTRRAAPGALVTPS
jgi:hypothetical protein